MLGRYKKSKHGLYIMSKENIENEAENILNIYGNDYLKKPQKIDIEKIIEDIGINLCYASLSKKSEILGAFVFNSGFLITYNGDGPNYVKYNAKTMIIDSKIADTNDVRLRFTYGHELGHYVIQYSLFHINDNQMSLFDNVVSDKEEVAIVCNREIANYDNLEENHKKLETKEDWQEWQANYFSSCILIPKCTLKIALKPYLDSYNVMEQTSILNKLDGSELDKLISNLCVIYDVSNEMMINRLKSLKYLN